MVPGRTPQPQPNRRSDHQPNIRAGQGEQEPVITRAAQSEPVALGEHADDRRRPLRQRPAAIRALPPGTALLLATGIKPALIHLTPWYLGPRAGEITAAQHALLCRCAARCASSRRDAVPGIDRVGPPL